MPLNPFLQKICAALLARSSELSPNELAFIENIKKSRNTNLSDKQGAWLQAIAERLGVKVNAKTSTQKTNLSARVRRTQGNVGRMK